MTGTRVYNLCANVYYLRQKPEILLYSLNDNDEVGMQFAKIASQESQLVTHRHRWAGTRIPMDRLRREARETFRVQIRQLTSLSIKQTTHMGPEHPDSFKEVAAEASHTPN